MEESTQQSTTNSLIETHGIISEGIFKSKFAFFGYSDPVYIFINKNRKFSG